MSPRPKRGVDGALGVGTSYGFASATLKSPTGELVRVHGNGQNVTDFNDNAAGLSGLFPASGALRFAGNRFDVTPYMQWQNVGLGSRFELVGGAEQALGLRLGGMTDYRGKAYEGSAGLEHVLPNFGGVQPFYQLRFSFGRAFHKLEVGSLDETAGLDNRADVAKLRVYRTELVGELTLAATLRASHKGSLTLGLAPSVVLDAGPLREMGCSNCFPGTTVVDFSQTFKLALLVGFAPN
jgi:hypothetical protein